MKFFVPNYSCLKNPWLGGYRPQIPVLSVLNWICWTPPPTNKIPVYATVRMDVQMNSLKYDRCENFHCDQFHTQFVNIHSVTLFYIFVLHESMSWPRKENPLLYRELCKRKHSVLKYKKFFVQATTPMIRVIHFDSINSFVAQRDFYYHYLAPWPPFVSCLMTPEQRVLQDSQLHISPSQDWRNGGLQRQ